jgi:hypothetical protein
MPIQLVPQNMKFCPTDMSLTLPALISVGAPSKPWP